MTSTVACTTRLVTQPFEDTDCYMKE